MFANIMRKLYHYKLLIGCMAFLLYMIFGYEYSLVRLIQLDNQAAELQSEIRVYRDTIAHFEQRIQEMNSATEELERYAREKLRMHASNEDLYVFDD